MKGWGWMHALHPDDIENTKHIWRKAVETRTEYETEYRIRRYDGVYRHFIARGIPVLNDDGGIREWVGTCIDITERKRMEASLARDADEIKRSAEEWLRTFDSISDFIFIQDQNYTITKANRAFARLLKRDPDDLIGRKCYELLHGMDEPWPECPFEKSRKDGKPHTEVVEDPKIGMPLLVTTSPILDEQGRFAGSVHLAKDITQAKEAERKLKEALEVKSGFVSMVSHELRTPLTAVKEGIGLVLDGIAGRVNEKQKEFLGIAKSNVERLARLINAVLDFQKLEAGKIEFDIRDNNLNEAVREVYTTMLPAARERGLELATRLDETLSKIRFDRDSIIQVLTNIIDNAIKYTEKGNIIISTARKGNVATVMVQDTGSGIHQEDIPRLFHSFEQLARGKDRKTGGTGLGLAISKQIIDAHRGKIWVESAPGRGSTFHFALPVKERRG
jgi:PAS domain S-box-containing protein